MKYQRPGYTESTLMLANYLKKFNLDDHKAAIDRSFKTFTNWLYTTSGFYDKNISGSYFDFDYEKITTSECFAKFLDIYEHSLLDCDKLNLLLHKIVDIRIIYDYANKLKAKDYTEFWHNYQKWYSVLKNTKVLIINSFAPLMVCQYESGNIHRIDPNFPILSDIIAYKTPYTFMNTGPDQNYFETLDKILIDINDIEYDVALVSCGSYACPIVDYVHNKNKIGISMGSSLHKMFGIDPDMKNHPLWISIIPDEYIPENYRKIEHGRYWVGRNPPMFDT